MKAHQPSLLPSFSGPPLPEVELAALSLGHLSWVCSTAAREQVLVHIWQRPFLLPAPQMFLLGLLVTFMSFHPMTPPSCRQTLGC